jgi:polysaccharide pyruvyl transferase WcaK-like protein
MTSDPHCPRIALLGNFGGGNLGNECTLQAMFLNIHQVLPSAQICVICPRPEDTALSYNLPAFSIRETPLPEINNPFLRFLSRICLGPPIEVYRWFKAIWRMAGCHMLVMTGTGMLGDLGIRPLGLHYDILRWSIAAKLCQCKLMFVSVGAGPIGRPLSRIFVKAALRLAEYRSYRDSFAKSYLEGIGFSTADDAVYPDLAFSLPIDMLPRSENREGRATVVGVGLITHNIKRATSEMSEVVYHNYLTRMAAIVRWLIQNKYTVKLLIGDVRYDQRVRQDLRITLERGGLRYEDAGIIDEPARSVEELLSQLAGTDIVVASRFHNVLLALMLNKPALAISFHQKVDSLMSDLGITQFCQDIENIDVKNLVLQLAALETNADNLTGELARRTAGYREALEKQYEKIFRRMETMKPVESSALAKLSGSFHQE